MRIGEDYDKIGFELFGLDLVEPNAMIGDSILFLTSIYFAYRVNKFGRTSPFFKMWTLFFVAFGFSFLFGGIGHTFFNYFDILGKYPGWYMGIIAVVFIELAMISIYPQKEKQRLFRSLSYLKFVLAVSGATLVFAFIDLQPDTSVGLKVPSLNTFIGLVMALGVLGSLYQKHYTPGFKYHILSLLALLPTAIFQTFKIGLAPWFDRNDLSHIFLLLSIILYYKGVKAYHLSLNQQATVSID